MIRFLSLVLLFLLVACSKEKPSKVMIIKQWHLAPRLDSTNIEQAKTFPQYQHQKLLYEFMLEQLDERYNTVVAEGCEGEIGKDFELKFNGWDLKGLQQKASSKEYADIITMAPLKVKAQDPGIKVVCGDDLELIQGNQLAMSDLRAFLGFYLNVRERKDPSYNEKVQLALKDLGHKVEGELQQYLKLRLVESWEKSFNFIYKRNDKFVKTIQSLGADYPLVVIGGIHVEDLTRKLTDAKVPFEVVTPPAYPGKDEELIHSISRLLSEATSTSAQRP